MWSRDISIEGFSFLFWHFLIWNLFPFLVILYKKWYYLVFQIHFFRKRRSRKELQRKAAVMLQVIPSFYTIYSKNSLFISADAYEKYIVCKDYCIVRHDDKMCFLPNWRYHIILIGNIKELLQKLDAFCFNYQHVDCLYTIFKYRFSSKALFSRVDNSLIICRGQFNSTSKTEEWTECPASRKTDSWGESTKKTFIELLPKDQIDAN